MAKKYCTYIPSKGADVFMQLKKKFGYQLAKSIFLQAIHPKFIEDNKGTLSLTAEGVPSLNSILENSYMKKYIGDTRLLNALNKEFTPVEDTRDNYTMLLQQAYNFNTNNPHNDKYTATIEYVAEKISIVLHPKTKEVDDIAISQYAGEVLNSKLLDMFSSLGLKIEDLLEAEVEEGKAGVTDFSRALDIANGFSGLIRVANNIEGHTAISEEFSHLIIAMFRNNPLVQRALTSLIENAELRKQILGKQYEDIVANYNDDSLVAEEALGQLLQRNLLSTTKQELQGYKNKSLLKRMIDYIVNLFKSFSISELSKAKLDAENAVKSITEILFKEPIITEKDIKSTYNNITLNALSERAKIYREMLEEAHKTELKRAKISSDESAAKNVYKVVEELESYKSEDIDPIEGVLYYIQRVSRSLTAHLTTLMNLDGMEEKDKFAALRRVKSYIYSYTPFLNSLNDLTIITDDSEISKDLTREVTLHNGEVVSVYSLIKDLKMQSDRLNGKFLAISTKLFANYLNPFMSKDMVISKDGTDIVVTVEDLLKEASSDISFFDYWLDSMAESSDVILQLFDRVYKNATHNTRLRTIEVIQKVDDLRMEAEAAGITNFDWMFELDTEGNKTGNYISSIDYPKFEKAYKEMLDGLKSKYGNNPIGEDAKKFLDERDTWLSKNSESTLIVSPKKSKYINSRYTKLSTKQKEILRKYIKLKEDLDIYYPSKRLESGKAIQVRKDRVDRLASSISSPKDFFDNIKNSIAESFISRSDDDASFGDVTRKGLKDFSGREFLILPILYTNRLENPNEISTDVFRALSMYAYSTINYDEMSKIIDPLEVGRTLVLENRKVRETRGGIPVVEKIKEDVTSKVFKPSGTNIEQKLNNFFETKIYQRYYKDEGETSVFGIKINNAKATNALISATATAQLGFNWLSNIANAINGISMTNIEAVAGEFFSYKELFNADNIYRKELASFIGELGARTKTSKLALFGELFNIKQDFSQQISTSQRSNVLQRFFGTRLAFLGQNAGDHWLYHRVAIAMALKTKVKVPGKGVTTLWEALEVQDVYKGNSQIKKLILPEGTTLENGDKVDIGHISEVIGEINRHLFGIYNPEDLNAANSISVGRLIMMFRKWMKPLFNKRFQGKRQNVILNREEEGYYRTAWRFMLGLTMELRNGKFNIIGQFDSLKEGEKRNCIRALVELVQLFAVWALANWIEWPDDKDRSWGLKLAEYTLKRQVHELGGLAPTPIMVDELMKTVKSPSAALNTINSILDLGKSVLWPADWNDEIQRGPYKGLSTLEKNILKAPIPGVTQYRQIDKFINEIDNSMLFYARSY